MNGDPMARSARMSALMALLVVLTAEAAPPVSEAPSAKVESVKVESIFARVAPSNDKPGRSSGQARAVVLIHGLNLFSGKQEKTGKLVLRTWQEPGSYIVKRFAEHADVYSFAYSQSGPVEK